jgi:hypothetical protein
MDSLPGTGHAPAPDDEPQCWVCRSQAHVIQSYAIRRPALIHVNLTSSGVPIERAMTRRHLVAFAVVTFAVVTFAISWGIPGAVLLGSRLTEAVPFSLATYSPLYCVGEGGPLLSTLLIIGWGHGQRAGWPTWQTHAWTGASWPTGGLLPTLGIPALYLLAAFGRGCAASRPSLPRGWEFSLLPFIAWWLKH